MAFRPLDQRYFDVPSQSGDPAYDDYIFTTDVYFPLSYQPTGRFRKIARDGSETTLQTHKSDALIVSAGYTFTVCPHPVIEGDIHYHSMHQAFSTTSYRISIIELDIVAGTKSISYIETESTTTQASTPKPLVVPDPRYTTPAGTYGPVMIVGITDQFASSYPKLFWKESGVWQSAALTEFSNDPELVAAVPAASGICIETTTEIKNYSLTGVYSADVTGSFTQYADNHIYVDSANDIAYVAERNSTHADLTYFLYPFGSANEYRKSEAITLTGNGGEIAAYMGSDGTFRAILTDTTSGTPSTEPWYFLEREIAHPTIHDIVKTFARNETYAKSTTYVNFAWYDSTNELAYVLCNSDPTTWNLDSRPVLEFAGLGPVIPEISGDLTAPSSTVAGYLVSYAAGTKIIDGALTAPMPTVAGVLEYEKHVFLVNGDITAPMTTIIGELDFIALSDITGALTAPMSITDGLIITNHNGSFLPFSSSAKGVQVRPDGFYYYVTIDGTKYKLDSFSYRTTPNGDIVNQELLAKMQGAPPSTGTLNLYEEIGGNSRLLFSGEITKTTPRGANLDITATSTEAIAGASYNLNEMIYIRNDGQITAYRTTANMRIMVGDFAVVGDTSFTVASTVTWISLNQRFTEVTINE